MWKPICFTLILIMLVPYIYTKSTNRKFKGSYEDSDWFKYCKDGRKKTITNKKCQSGFIFNEEFKSSDCFCAKGLWVLDSGNCKNEDRSIILNGDGKCYKINKEVKNALTLEITPEIEIHILKLGSNLAYTIETNISKFLSSQKLNEAEIILNPSQYKHVNCKEVKNPKNLSRKYNFGSHSSKKEKEYILFKTGKRLVIVSENFQEICELENKLRTPFKLKAGGILSVGAFTEVKEIEPEECLLPCSTKKRIRRDLESSDILGCSNHSIEDPSSVSYRNEYNNEESYRVLKQSVAFMLYGIKEDNLNISSNWIYMQKANSVMKKACPDIDPTLQNAFLRIFRFFYAHTRDESEPWAEYMSSTSRDKRILDLMDKCVTEAALISYDFGNETCDEEKKLKFATAFGNTVEVDDPVLSLDEAFAGSGMSGKDFVVEAIWKLVSFSHYYCSEYFEQTPLDHSALNQKLVNFFNKNIVHRWHNPSNFNAGLFTLFNTKYRMETYSAAIDNCVGAAKKLTKFKEFLKRPTEVNAYFRGKRSLKHGSRSHHTATDHPAHTDHHHNIFSSKNKNSFDPLLDGNCLEKKSPSDSFIQLCY